MFFHVGKRGSSPELLRLIVPGFYKYDMKSTIKETSHHPSPIKNLSAAIQFKTFWEATAIILETLCDWLDSWLFGMKRDNSSRSPLNQLQSKFRCDLAAHGLGMHSRFWRKSEINRHHLLNFGGSNGYVNPLRAKFFRGNINIYLHFMSLLHIDMAQVLKILSWVRPGLTYST